MVFFLIGIKTIVRSTDLLIFCRRVVVIVIVEITTTSSSWRLAARVVYTVTVLIF